MSEQPLRVLLVDDETSLREPLAKRLRDAHGYHVDTAADAAGAWRLVIEAERPYDVALIDDLLTPEPDVEPEPIGIRLLRRIKELCPETEVIIFTGWGMERALEALQAGAYRYLAKPLNLDELGMTIRMAAEQARLRRERDLLSATLEISRAMLSELDVGKTLEVIAEAVPKLVGAEACGVARMDPVTGKVQHEPVILLGDVSVMWHRHLRKIQLTKRIMEMGETFILPDVSTCIDEVDENLCKAGVKSFIGVPIPGEPENWGVLYAYSTRREAFGTHERRVLQLLAGQAAIALENARLFKQVTTERDTVKLLYKVSRKLSASGLDLDSVLQEILTLATNSVKADEGSLFIVSEDGQVRRWRNTGLPSINKETVEEILKRGFAGWVLKNRQGDIVPDIQTDKRWLSFPDDLLQRGSAIGMPVIYGGKTLGTLTLTCSEMAFFNEEHLNLLTSTADQAAIAIQNAMTFDCMQRHSRLLDALVEVSRKLAGTVDLHEQMKAVWLFVRNQLSAPMFFVALYDDLRDTLHFETIYEMGQPVSMPDKVLANREVWGLTGFVVKTGGTIEWYTFEQKQEALEKLGIQPRRVGVPCITCLVLPLMIGKQVIGAISIQSDRPYAWDEVCLDAFRALTSHVATSVKNAQLYQEAQAGFQTLQSLYEGGSAIISTMDPERILDVIVQKAHRALGGCRAEVILITEIEEPIELAALGFDERPDIATWIRPDGISVQVMRSGRSRIIENVRAESDTVNPRMLQDGAGAAACVPLNLRGKSIGVMWIQFEAPRRFLPAEIEALHLYANQAAIAYDNARRMQELKHMRKAAEALAGAAGLQEVLKQIVRSAREVLLADSLAIWSYDNVRNQFIPEELVAYGIPRDELEKFKKKEPKKGGTADTVMDQGWVGITDVSDPQHDFMGPSTLELLDSIGAKSFQGIALKIGAEKLGVLYVNYSHPRDFTDEGRRTLETFAYHAALALKNARLLAQMQRTREAAGVIAGVTVQEDLEQTLKTIARHTQQVLHSDAVTLYSYDETTGQFGEWATEIVAARDPDSARLPGKIDQRSAVGTIFGLEGPTCYHLAEDHADQDNLLAGHFVRTEGIRSAIGIQLRVGERKLGVMFVNFRSPHHFTTDEITTVQLFADQAAVAIRNAQLYQAEQRHGQALKAIQETSAAVSAVLDLHVLFPMITHKAAEIFSAPATSLMLWDEHQENLVIRAAFGLGDEYQREQRIARRKVDELLEKKGMGPHIFDIYHEPIGKRELVKKEKLYTSLVAPLMVGNELIGALHIYSKDEPYRFEEKEMELATIFANHAAIAIQNARQYEELKWIKGLVGARTALAWMAMAGSAWRHTVDRHALTIREQSQLLYIDLSKICSGEQHAHVTERLSMIERLASQILKKPITTPLSTEWGMKSVFVNDLVGERAKQLWRNEPYRRARLRLDLCLDEEATVRVGPEWLRQAIDMLIDNAVEAVTNCDVREIVVGTHAAGEGAEIWVSDTGPGISTEIRLKVGREPIEKPEDVKGLGMGLLLAQAIAEAYGGEIRIDATGPTGTTVVIWLPLEEKGV